MPFSLKKYLCELKTELGEHLWLAKNKNRLENRRKINDAEKTRVIRNDLRRPSKNDKNSYRDYSTRCDEATFYQKNCAPSRCNQQPKLRTNNLAIEEKIRSDRTLNNTNLCDDENCENWSMLEPKLDIVARCDTIVGMNLMFAVRLFCTFQVECTRRWCRR